MFDINAPKCICNLLLHFKRLQSSDATVIWPQTSTDFGKTKLVALWKINLDRLCRWALPTASLFQVSGASWMWYQVKRPSQWVKNSQQRNENNRDLSSSRHEGDPQYRESFFYSWRMKSSLVSNTGNEYTGILRAKLRCKTKRHDLSGI